MLRYALLVLIQLRFFVSGAGEKTHFWSVADGFPQYKNFGQISAVSVDSADNVYVFHRGDRVWDYSTFSLNHIYQGRARGPIPEETIVVLSPSDGALKKKAGARIFYMPHGLTVDYMNNVWVTDVALHQVFKFPPLNFTQNSGLSQPLLTLGEPFVPGNDLKHFCKPTDVAVDKTTGDFYVSDGYCNSRIIKYDKFGKKLLNWGRSSQSPTNEYGLNVPHALALSLDQRLIFVADRENYRTLSYKMETGNFVHSYLDKRPIYSVTYSSVGGSYLFTLSNASYQYPGIVTVYDIKSNEVVGTFPSSFGFSQPHDIAVSSDGKSCYVVELKPYKVWKFRLGKFKLYIYFICIICFRNAGILKSLLRSQFHV
ncbi:UNVERIFIED_CONTAM: hypothetical protein PYX00_000444 [Menopon gallinae]|uniref:peptidylamidoglycolate lyase n=1 Tax=Menopon gallinae TaxID=328185 RepID=A0AAW2I8J2_9NEOP